MRDCLFCESELTLPKAICAGHAAKETRKHVREILKLMDLHKISKHSKSRGQTFTQAKDIIKMYKFCETFRYCGKCPTYGKVCHNCNSKTILRSAVYIIEKLHKIEQTKTESPSVDEYEFYLDTINLQRNSENLANTY